MSWISCERLNVGKYTNLYLFIHMSEFLHLFIIVIGLVVVVLDTIGSRQFGFFSCFGYFPLVFVSSKWRKWYRRIFITTIGSHKKEIVCNIRFWLPKTRKTFHYYYYYEHNYNYNYNYNNCHYYRYCTNTNTNTFQQQYNYNYKKTNISKDNSSFLKCHVC